MSELGSQIKWALSQTGITEERISHWLGRPCGCSERVRKLDQLSLWAKQVLKGKSEKATEYLKDITGG